MSDRPAKWTHRKYPLCLRSVVRVKSRPESIFANQQSLWRGRCLFFNDVIYQLTAVENASKRSEGIENLPCELQRNFTLMRDLDNRTEEKKGEIDKLAEEYIANVKNLASEQRVEHLQKIQNAYSKCKEFSDDKVQLAMQTYEMVDKHIRRLDADLARFENELKEKLEQSGYESADGRALKSTSESEMRSQREKRGSRGRGRKGSDEDSPRKKKKASPVLSDALLPMQPSDVLDMPVDPNEPTYCLCHQVSYGEMIGCDNPDCPIEWFHFACVDLATKPKGKWFCPRASKVPIGFFIPAALLLLRFVKLHLQVVHKVRVVFPLAVPLEQCVHLSLFAGQLLVIQFVQILVRVQLERSEAVLQTQALHVIAQDDVEFLQLV
ncbi:hypothetical protein CCH79_00011213 [Gambusia affinis]|uniref:Inhibitor of growth protein n=1 Tax=Gambusia affinis TaxID=33528 RepID=A0A315USG4_GAMAF|nr:hypothetical protein CCH79_00011213 [Gambusia affinis]